MKNITTVGILLFSLLMANSAKARSLHELDVPATKTCAVLWDKDVGALSRETLSKTSRAILQIPDTEESRKKVPKIAGKSIELDLEGLHNLPNEMVDQDAVLLGETQDGVDAFAPYALYSEIVGCLPCPKLPLS